MNTKILKALEAKKIELKTEIDITVTFIHVRGKKPEYMRRLTELELKLMKVKAEIEDLKNRKN